MIHVPLVHNLYTAPRHMKNVRFTIPTQQVYNTLLHEGGAQCVGSTLM
jgi:hypothetical protein